MDSTPDTGRREPSSASSPIHRVSSASSNRICPLASRIPAAMAKSKAEPSLRTSAGARFTVIRSIG
ncbi:hypothetical protein D3C75_1329890 [compost metagenome]